MEPTLGVGSHVWAKPQTSNPGIGEIVVFHPPNGASLTEQSPVCGPVDHVVKFGGAACAEPVAGSERAKFIKRVIAGPGDAIYIKEGHVYRKPAGSDQFEREGDSYTNPCGASPECDFPTPIKIPPEHWFLLGDNRGESDDSRLLGSSANVLDYRGCRVVLLGRDTLPGTAG